MVQLLQGDCLELMKEIPDGSVDLVLTDPPYNIGVTTKKNGTTVVNEWDHIDGYINWCIGWLTECQRVLKPTGVLYFFHNDMEQIAELLCEIRKRTSLTFVSFCIWDKGDSYRARSWHHRIPGGKTTLRSWFNVCEYCLHFFNSPPGSATKYTGLERINSNPECYKPLKEWYASELDRLGLTKADIAQKYREVTGKEPHMLGHYFADSQFAIPTKEVWDSVYIALGLRKEYEGLRNVHNCDGMHCNIWHIPPIPSQGRYHTCQKPVDLLERLCRVSTNEGGVVLDPFMGSGSTGVAAVNTGRSFIGVELDTGYFEAAQNRISEAVEANG